ncbi:MAG: tyrosine-protein phosphatase [Phycisphaerae bacterium]
MLSARWKLLFTLLVLVPVGCGFGVYDSFAPLTPLDNWGVVEPGRLYRSAQLDAETLALLIDVFDIRTVVNLRGENASEPWYDNEAAVLDAKGVALVDVRMSASALPAREELLKLYDTFLTAEEPILIHCRGGADRTGAAAAIWRMVVLGDEREEAAEELCICYGHFEAFTPAMDELVRIFQPNRTWIEEEYPGP